MASKKKIELDMTVVASKDQASADLGDEAAILNLSSGIYYGLDPVGARIWKLVQAPRTVREVRDTLLDEYDVDVARCERDLVSLLEQLEQHDLITIVDHA